MFQSAPSFKEFMKQKQEKEELLHGKDKKKSKESDKRTINIKINLSISRKEN